jgi:hypothetical protein
VSIRANHAHTVARVPGQLQGLQQRQYNNGRSHVAPTYLPWYSLSHTWPDFTAFCTSPIIMSTPHVDALPFWPKGASGVIPPLRSPEMTERDLKRHQRYVTWLHLWRPDEGGSECPGFLRGPEVRSCGRRLVAGPLQPLLYHARCLCSPHPPGI